MNSLVLDTSFNSISNEISPYELNKKEISSLSVNDKLIKTLTEINIAKNNLELLSSQDKNKLSSKYNSQVNKHRLLGKNNLLYVHFDTLEFEWEQFNDNKKELDKLFLKNNNDSKLSNIKFILNNYIGNDIYKKMPSNSIKILVRRYNVAIAGFRNSGYHKLLTINHQLNFDPRIIKSNIKNVSNKKIKVCSLTGDEPEQNYISLLLSRRISIKQDSSLQIFNALKASIESPHTTIFHDIIFVPILSKSNEVLTTNNIKKIKGGSFDEYSLNLYFPVRTNIDVITPRFINSKSKKIQHSLVSHGKFISSITDKLVILEGERFKLYIEYHNLVKKEIIRRISNDPNANVKVFYCTNENCIYQEGFFIKKRNEYNDNNNYVKCINCNCDKNFCYKCGKKYHFDYDCNGDIDQESMDLILNTSKPCPNCKIPIEKNEGCNHMTCKLCFQNWCWICNQIFPTTDPYHPNGCPNELLLY